MYIHTEYNKCGNDNDETIIKIKNAIIRAMYGTKQHK